jgi:hypothetical protein
LGLDRIDIAKFPAPIIVSSRRPSFIGVKECGRIAAAFAADVLVPARKLPDLAHARPKFATMTTGSHLLSSMR